MDLSLHFDARATRIGRDRSTYSNAGLQMRVGHQFRRHRAVSDDLTATHRGGVPFGHAKA